MNSGIYVIFNFINNKFYIGSTNNFSKRVYSHKYSLSNNIHANPILQCAWNKYGEVNFKFVLIEEVETQDLIAFEQLYLDEFIDNQINCYNINPVASHVVVPSGKKHPMCGKKHTEEFKQQVSETLKGRRSPMKGRKQSEKWLKQMRERIGENHQNFGKRHSEEARKKISEAGLNRIVSEETRQRMSKSHLGKKCSEETKKNLRRSKPTNNTSGVVGVSFNKSRNRFVAYVIIDRKQKYIGQFETIEEAAIARQDYLQTNNL